MAASSRPPRHRSTSNGSRDGLAARPASITFALRATPRCRARCHGPPSRPRSIKERGSNCGGGGCVANAHLSDHQHVSRGVHSGPSSRYGLCAFRLRHGWALCEGLCRHIQREGHHIQPRPGDGRKLVDRRATGFEVRHHLRRHFRREGRNPLGRDAVVARENNNLRGVEAWLHRPLPARNPDREILQSAKGPRRLGELAVAIQSPLRRIQVRPRQIRKGVANGGRGW